MYSFFCKTFGGLTARYYIRHLLFGLVFCAALIWGLAHTKAGLSGKWGAVVFSTVSSLLYPYARFVYESVVGYVIGENVFYGPAIPMLMVKAFTMLMCWSMAVFIAPLGLIYLYFHHSRRANA